MISISGRTTIKTSLFATEAWNESRDLDWDNYPKMGKDFVLVNSCNAARNVVICGDILQQKWETT